MDHKVVATMSADAYQRGYDDAVSNLRLLAELRAGYLPDFTGEVEKDVRITQHLADMLSGDRDPCGWAPSWLWGRWDSESGLW